MKSDPHQKVQASHLKRNAYLYIRQSTLRQVFENTESTKRQYALRQRAVALGWSEDRIIVIDSDLGQSGASSADAKDSSVWSPKLAWVMPASCSAWRCRASRATPPTGIGCSRSAQSPTH